MRRFGFNPFTRADGEAVHEAQASRVTEGLRPHVGRVVAMAEAGSALADHEERRSLGRTVVDTDYV